MLRASPIDWCEGNRPEINPFGVMELHNTWTNIAYVIAGIAFICRVRQNLSSRSNSILKRSSSGHNYQNDGNIHNGTSNSKAIKLDYLYVAFGLSVIATGIASAWFHATLIFVAQKADEIFESLACLCLLYLNRHPLSRVSAISVHRRSSWLTPVVRTPTTMVFAGFHAIAMCIAIIFIPEAFCEIHLIATVLYTFGIASGRIAAIKDDKARHDIKHLFFTAFVCVAFAFFCWIIDFALCSPFVQSLNLHAFVWHPLTALALYYGGIASLLLDHHLVHQLQEKQR